MVGEICLVHSLAGLIRVVQCSLVGSILSNLLLVLGLCFLCGGWKYSEQTFNETSAQTSAALLALSVMALIVPASFDYTMGRSVEKPDSTSLALSHGTAIILLIVYGLYLYFQLKTHRHLYENPEAVLHEAGAEVEEPKMILWVAMVCLLVSTVLVAIAAEFMVGSIEGITKAGVNEIFVGMILVPIVGNAAGE